MGEGGGPVKMVDSEQFQFDCSVTGWLFCCGNKPLRASVLRMEPSLVITSVAERTCSLASHLHIKEAD